LRRVGFNRENTRDAMDFMDVEGAALVAPIIFTCRTIFYTHSSQHETHLGFTNIRMTFLFVS
jgi:hypothetical protein